jgi:hypothetical protein
MNTSSSEVEVKTFPFPPLIAVVFPVKIAMKFSGVTASPS